MNKNQKLFGGLNPLTQAPLLELSELPYTRGGKLFRPFPITPMPGSRKVREGFEVYIRRLAEQCCLLFADTDKIGAFDQKHVISGTDVPAHYAGKGMITAAFSNYCKPMIAAAYMPTDYLPLNDFFGKWGMPPAIFQRLSLHAKAAENILVEFIVRSSDEGSLEEKAREGKPKCGQELPPDLSLGQMLPRPYFTPTTKAPPGQKDRDLTLEEYYQVIGDDDLANYLYGVSIILHLANRGEARKKGLDRSDQKMEFALFNDTAPRFNCPSYIRTLSIDSMEHLFDDLCRQAGFYKTAWREMPLFSLGDFVLFHNYNTEAWRVRLKDEYGGTDDGRYRTLADTERGQTLIATGQRELGKVFMENYLCKEWFRLRDKESGQADYHIDASQIVQVPPEILQETGRRNLMALLMLIS